MDGAGWVCWIRLSWCYGFSSGGIRLSSNSVGFSSCRIEFSRYSILFSSSNIRFSSCSIQFCSSPIWLSNIISDLLAGNE